MNALLEAILTFTNWIWGIPMLILLVGGGCFLAVRLNMLPYRKLPFILTHTIGKSFTKIEGPTVNSADGKRPVVHSLQPWERGTLWGPPWQLLLEDRAVFFGSGLPALLHAP